MQLMHKEMEKLMLHYAGSLAKKRMRRGLKLNYQEAVALITSELMEASRDGRTVQQIMNYGMRILSRDDVMDNVADSMPELKIELDFQDETKIVTIHNPIR
ncbi:urease subunit gamma [Clostridium pasteurianum]|uniref:Urease subunit gamma n=1 Tax=Clostridium pasteurianum BC1 TaxID=86416 RepID=R4JXZ8_CLOPA|nr:urease subunit gamma [Clostridium pasteurianum]AGK95687.1 urease, gamma subunit [Clostridium pasteurianum BC1]